MTEIPKTLDAYAEYILTQMKDNALTNRLVDGLRNDMPFVKSCIISAIDEFNNEEPVKFSFSLANFPSRSKLVDGVKKWIIDGVIEEHLGNDAQFNDGAGPVRDKGKHSEYTQIQMKYEQRWREYMSKIKLAANIGNGYGTA